MAISTPFTQDHRVLPLSAPLSSWRSIDCVMSLALWPQVVCQASQPHFRSSKAPATCDCSFSRPLYGQWVNNCWRGWQNRTDLGKSTHLYDETQGNTSNGRFFFFFFFFPLVFRRIDEYIFPDLFHFTVICRQSDRQIYTDRVRFAKGKSIFQ